MNDFRAEKCNVFFLEQIISSLIRFGFSFRFLRNNLPETHRPDAVSI